MGEQEIYLQLEAQDNAGAAAPPQVLGPIWFGNSAPKIEINTNESLFNETVILSIKVDDDDGDSVSLEVEFRDNNESGVWRRAEIIVGELDALAPREALYQLAWNSAAASESDPTLPQGLGSINTDRVSLRVRGIDQIGETRFYGPWATIDNIQVVNQTPPNVAQVSLVNPPRLVAGALGVAYQLSDDEGDSASIELSYSVDRGASWHPCTEYPDARSEGLRHLATIAENGGPQEHLYIWDTTADVILRQSTRLRIRASDSENSGTYLELEIGELGQDADIDSAHFASRWNFFGGRYQKASMRNAQMSNNGNDVVLTLTDGSAHLGIIIPQDITQSPPNGVLTTSYPPSIAKFSIGDFNEDGFDDVATISTDTNLMIVRIANPGDIADPLSASTTYDLNNLSPIGLSVGDIDGDTHLDIIVNGLNTDTNANEMVSFLGDGSGGHSLSSSRFVIDETRVVIASVDLNGDGRADLLTCILGDIAPLHAWLSMDSMVAGELEIEGPIDIGLELSSDIVAGDFDGDGTTDISGLRNNEVVLATGRGIDLLSAGLDERVVSVSTIPPSSLRWIDGNGDGRLDLWTQSEAEFALYPGSPTAVVQGSPTFRGGPDFPCFDSATVLEADGIVPPEILVSYRSESCNYIDDGSGAPLFFLLNFFSPTVVNYPFSSEVETEVGGRVSSLIDLNLDGALDRIEIRPPELWVQHAGSVAGLPTGQFDVAERYTIEALGRPAEKSLMADLDGDGHLDVLGWARDGGFTYLMWMRAEVEMGVPSGRFEDPQPLLEGEEETWIPIDAGDIDNDGDADLLSSQGAVLSQFEQSPVFSEVQLLPPGSDISTGRFAHLNEDRVLDIVTIARYFPSTSSPGYYAAMIDGVTYSTICPDDPSACAEPECHTRLGSLMQTVEELEVVDLDDDGRQDLIWVSHRFSDVTLYTESRDSDQSCTPFNSNQSFDLDLTQGSSNLVDDSLSFSDIDADGALDILRGNIEDEPLAFYNASSGGIASATFNSPQVLALGPTAKLLAVDVDHNGLLNLVGTQGNGFAAITASRPRNTPFEALSFGLENTDHVGVVFESDDTNTPRLIQRLSERRDESLQSFFEQGRAVDFGEDFSLHNFSPLTQAWWVEGDLHAVVEAQSPNDVRTRLRHRLGPTQGGRPAGLDLMDSDGLGRRGVVLHLPIPAARVGAEVGREVRVLARSNSWRRAKTIEADPLFDSPSGDDLLPQVSRSNKDGTLWWPEWSWRIVNIDDDGDILTGEGEAFLVDGAEVLIRVDRLGDFQAVVER